MKKQIIATNGKEEMTLEDFLIWEMEGGKGTYENDGKIPFDSLPMNEKLSWMANSIYDDIISDGWRLEVRSI